MSLENVLKKIEEEKVVAETDLNTVDPRVYPYKKGQVDRARENLEELYIEYKNELLKNALFILVTGDKSDQFSQIAEEKFNCFSVDGEGFYREIVDVLSPDLYFQKNLNASVFDIVSNVLEDKVKNLDIVSYNSLLFNSKYSKFVNSKSEMVDIVKNAINDNIGSEIIGYDALERVTRDAVNKGYKSRIVPIIIHSKDEDFISELSGNLKKLNSRIRVVSAGDVKNKNRSLLTVEEVNEENIGNALKEIATNA